MSASHAHDDHGHHDGPHVTPLPIYFAVFGALLVLTVVTVWIAGFDFGAANTAIAMLVATVKATLVAAIFMHLLYDERLNALAFVFGLIFVSLFFIFTMLDVFTRQHIDPARGNHALAAAAVDDLRLEVEKAQKIEPAPVPGDEALAPADERAFVPPPAPPAPVTEAPKAQVQFTMIGARAAISGQVVSGDLRDALVAAAKAAVGEANVTDSVLINESLATPQWLGEIGSVFGALKAVRGLSIAATDAGLIVDGRVETEADKTAVANILAEKVKTLAVTNRLIVKAASDEAKERLDALMKSAIGTDLYFAAGTDALNESAQQTLEQVANLLHEIPALKVEVGAHVDQAGGAGKALSQKQADAVKAALVTRGIDARRVSAKGFGNSKPVADAPVEQQRRIEYTIR